MGIVIELIQLSSGRWYYRFRSRSNIMLISKDYATKGGAFTAYTNVMSFVQDFMGGHAGVLIEIPYKKEKK